MLNLKTDISSNFQPIGGDLLHIPRRPQSVTVTGEVLSSTSHSFNSELGVSDYINLSGGITDLADESKIFVIQPNGQSIPFRKSLFQNKGNVILPGSTIVVSRDTTPYDAIKITQIVMPILSDLATSAAAIAAISD